MQLAPLYLVYNGRGGARGRALATAGAAVGTARALFGANDASGTVIGNLGEQAPWVEAGAYSHPLLQLNKCTFCETRSLMSFCQ
jgi:hypothetical protein